MSAPTVPAATRIASHTAIYNLDIACDLLNNLIFMPGWTITAKPNGAYEQGITITVILPAVDADRDQAPEYNKPLKLAGLPEGFQMAEFLVICDGCSEIELLRKVLDKLILCLVHEAREFFRYGPSKDAPFHPHHIAGMNAWGEPEKDQAFGIVRR
jgi:hypothetical protein